MVTEKNRCGCRTHGVDVDLIGLTEDILLLLKPPSLPQAGHSNVTFLRLAVGRVNSVTVMLTWSFV